MGDISFSRIFTYKEQVSRSISWGHHFLFLNILLAILAGSSYVYAAPAADSFTAFCYLFVTLFGHMSFLCCVLYLLWFFPLSFIGNFRWYRVISVLSAVLIFAVLLFDIKLYLAVRVHISFTVLQLIFTQLDFNTGLNYNFLFIAVPVVIACELIFAKLATRYLYSYKKNKLLWIRVAIIFLTGCFISSHCIHIWADATRYDKVTMLRSVFPAHYPMTARTFLESHGWLSEKNRARSSTAENIQYPLQPLAPAEELPPACNLLIVFVNGISMSDLSSADTPVLWQLGNTSLSFDRHYLPYSSLQDNLFASSYGLPRLYRNSLQAGRITPVVLDELLRQEYTVRTLVSAGAAQSGAVVSATGLRQVQVESMGSNVQALSQAQSLFLDVRAGQHVAVTLLLNNLLQPELTAVQRRMQLKATDAALGELLSSLHSQGSKTFVIISSLAGNAQELSDGSAYSRSASHVPLFVLTPEGERGHIQELSSVYDFAPTIGIQVLGVTSPSGQYSLGYDLLSLPQRDFIVSDSDDLLLIGDRYTTVYRASGSSYIERDGRRLQVQPNLRDLISAMRELNRFQK